MRPTKLLALVLMGGPALAEYLKGVR